jgi:hypothetical protein
MREHENDTAEVPTLVEKIRGLAATALDLENACAPADEKDEDVREILAVLKRVGPVNAAFAAGAHLAIRQLVRDQLERLGFAGEALAPLLYELYDYCNYVGLDFQEGRWLTTEQHISQVFGPEAAEAWRGLGIRSIAAQQSE